MKMTTKSTCRLHSVLPTENIRSPDIDFDTPATENKSQNQNPNLF